MPRYFSYVAEKPEGMSEASGPDRLPERLIPEKLGDSLGIDGGWMFSEIHFHNKRGWQIDWGSWCLPMTRLAICEMLGAEHPYKIEIDKLDAYREYLVVTVESS